MIVALMTAMAQQSAPSVHRLTPQQILSRATAGFASPLDLPAGCFDWSSLSLSYESGSEYTWGAAVDCSGSKEYIYVETYLELETQGLWCEIDYNDDTCEYDNNCSDWKTKNLASGLNLRILASMQIDDGGQNYEDDFVDYYNT